jgi:uncharacterized protein
LKLHAQPPTNLNTVTAYGPGFIEINRVRQTGNLILIPDAPVQAWTATGYDDLRSEDFDGLLAFTPEVVLVGTGLRQRMLHPRLTAGLARAGIGVEVMDTAAACRTYNILMVEGRRVLAAFLLES